MQQIAAIAAICCTFSACWIYEGKKPVTIWQGSYNLAIAAIAAVSCTFSAFHSSQWQGSYNLAIAAIAAIAPVLRTFSAFQIYQQSKPVTIWHVTSLELLQLHQFVALLAHFISINDQTHLPYNEALTILQLLQLRPLVALLAHFVSINDQTHLPYNEALTILQLLQLRPLVALLAHFTSIDNKALKILQLRQFVALLAHVWSVRALLYGRLLQSWLDLRCAKSTTSCCNCRNLLHF